MKATVQRVNLSAPYCEATTSNDLIFSFIPESDNPPRVGDVLKIDLMILEKSQKVMNLTQETEYLIRLRAEDIHDLRLPASHGTSRFPAVDRRKGNA